MDDFSSRKNMYILVQIVFLFLLTGSKEEKTSHTEIVSVNDTTVDFILFLSSTENCSAEHRNLNFTDEGCSSFVSKIPQLARNFATTFSETKNSVNSEVSIILSLHQCFSYICLK